MINVHEVDASGLKGNIVARVNRNDNLDFWDGSDMNCGAPFSHKGLTKLRKSGDYVLIHMSQWQGARDWAEIITPNRAVDEILFSGNTELLDKYPDLQEIAKNLDYPRIIEVDQEMEETDNEKS